jgi:hypothetical protein
MRIPRPRRRLLIAAAVAAGLLVATVAVIRYGVPYWRHLEMRRQLAAFKANPTQENANPLARILIHEQLSDEEAQEIVQAWLDLKVATRQSYRPGAGNPILIALASGNATLLLDPPPGNPEKTPTSSSWRIFFGVMKRRTTLRIPDLVGDKGTLNSAPVLIDPSLTGKVWDPEAILRSDPRGVVAYKPGVYAGLVKFEGLAGIVAAIHPVNESTGTLDKALIFLGLREDPGRLRPKYEITIEVPFEIRVEDGPDEPADEAREP